MTEQPGSFLDAVRRLGDATITRCGDGDCDPALHRKEAAAAISAVVADLELATYVVQAARRRRKRQATVRGPLREGESAPKQTLEDRALLVNTYWPLPYRVASRFILADWDDHPIKRCPTCGQPDEDQETTP